MDRYRGAKIVPKPGQEEALVGVLQIFSKDSWAVLNATTGTGKTFVSMMVAQSLLKGVTCVCPSSIMSMWEEVLPQFFNNNDFNVFSSSSLKNFFSPPFIKNPKIDHHRYSDFTPSYKKFLVKDRLLIIDELVEFKNFSSTKTNYIRLIIREIMNNGGKVIFMSYAPFDQPEHIATFLQLVRILDPDFGKDNPKGDFDIITEKRMLKRTIISIKTLRCNYKKDSINLLNYAVLEKVLKESDLKRTSARPLEYPSNNSLEMFREVFRLGVEIWAQHAIEIKGFSIYPYIVNFYDMFAYVDPQDLIKYQGHDYKFYDFMYRFNKTSETELSENVKLLTSELASAKKNLREAQSTNFTKKSSTNNEQVKLNDEKVTLITSQLHSARLELAKAENPILEADVIQPILEELSDATVFTLLEYHVIKNKLIPLIIRDLEEGKNDPTKKRRILLGINYPGANDISAEEKGILNKEIDDEYAKPIYPKNKNTKEARNKAKLEVKKRRKIATEKAHQTAIKNKFEPVHTTRLDEYIYHLRDYEPLEITAEAKDRQKIAKLFGKGSKNLLVLSISSGSVGLSAHYTGSEKIPTSVYYLPSFNYLTMVQFQGRTIRAGVMSNTEMFLVWPTSQNKILAEAEKGDKGTVYKELRMGNFRNNMHEKYLITNMFSAQDRGPMLFPGEYPETTNMNFEYIEGFSKPKHSTSQHI